MEVNVSQTDLKRTLSLVSLAIAAKTTMPILSNVKLTATDGFLQIEATNLEMAIRYSISATVTKQGSTTLPSKLFNDLISNLPNDMVTITTDMQTDMSTVKCGKFTSSINGISASDFPDLPDIFSTGEVITTMNTSIFREAMQQCVIAAAGDNSRPVLAGIYVQFPKIDEENTESTVTLSAADGFRLANKKIAAGTRITNDAINLIIPANALSILIRMLSSASEEVKIAKTNNNIGFAFNTIDGKAVLMGRIIEGNYPDIARVMPKDYATRVEVNKMDLLKAIRVAKLFAVASNNIVRFDINPIIGIEIKANGDGKGNNASTVDAQIIGEHIEIALNVQYAEDALSTIPTEKVIIELQSKQQPAVFVPDDLSHYRHVVMPMQVR
jgi:DNA polymerase-3 subunit beta